ncbi:MAG: phosphoethanolamine transferase [Dysgonomonas sp.]|nr:phosphoethanolamine transferase [Dysgonomonas sp.]
MKSILNIICLLLIVNALAKTKFKFALIFNVLLIISLCIDGYFAFVYSELMSPAIAASIIETNTNEAISMLKGIIPIATVIIAFTIFIIYKTEKELKKSIIPRWLSLSIAGIFFLIILPISIYGRVKKDINRDDFHNSAGIPSIIHSYISSRMPLVFSNWGALLLYYYEIKAMKDYSNGERLLPNGLILSDNNDSIPSKIFIIIGESSYRGNYSLYGYNRKTTPFLDSLSSIPNSNLSYAKGISAAPITRDAIPLALSFATSKNKKPFYEEMNAVELAKNAGYQTIWISVQETIRMNENYVSHIASTADTSEYKLNLGVKDLDLIPIINKYLEPEKKQCFFIHTNGSHEHYKDRVTSEDINYISGNSITDQYDQSIYHTDRFFREVNNISLKNEPSAIFYFSDHGEIIGKAHGFVHGGLEQYEVPIFIINNNSTLRTDSIIERFTNKETLLANTTNSIYIIAQLLGYQISNRTIEQCIIDGDYVFHSDGKARTPKEVEDMKK